MTIFRARKMKCLVKNLATSAKTSHSGRFVLLVKVRCLFSSSKKRFWPSNHWRSPEITPAVKPCVKTTEVSGCCEVKENYFLLERYQHVSTTGGLKMEPFFLQFAFLFERVHILFCIFLERLQIPSWKGSQNECVLCFWKLQASALT